MSKKVLIVEQDGQELAFQTEYEMQALDVLVKDTCLEGESWLIPQGRQMLLKTEIKNYGAIRNLGTIGVV